MRIQCVPAFTPSAEKQADTLEDDDDRQFASACEPVEQVRSGTPTEDPELLKSEGV